MRENMEIEPFFIFWLLLLLGKLLIFPVLIILY